VEGLHSDGREVTFLVRPRSAAELADTGLVIKRPNGDVTLKNPPPVQADNSTKNLTWVWLSCKASTSARAASRFAPEAGPQTAIITLINGCGNLDVLEQNSGESTCRRHRRDRRHAQRSVAKSSSSNRCSHSFR